jgi:hypothetical protein
MLGRRTRNTFSLCLTFALLPILSAAAGRGESRAHGAMAWMQLQARSQSGAQVARASLDQVDANHPSTTPFLPAARFTLELIPVGPTVAAPASRTLVVAAVAALHPARAPPALL